MSHGIRTGVSIEVSRENNPLGRVRCDDVLHLIFDGIEVSMYLPMVS